MSTKNGELKMTDEHMLQAIKEAYGEYKLQLARRQDGVIAGIRLIAAIETVFNMTACQDCKYLRVIEDRTDDMRKPYGYCSKEFDIVEIDIMEWRPQNGTCEMFLAGEPTEI